MLIGYARTSTTDQKAGLGAQQRDLTGAGCKKTFIEEVSSVDIAARGQLEAAIEFAFDVLEEGGTFVAKVLAGGAEASMQTLLKKNFTKVANVKPPASRADSSEKFVVAMGFKRKPKDEVQSLLD